MSTALPEKNYAGAGAGRQTKTELAGKLGVSVAAVSQWEDGSKNPTAREPGSDWPSPDVRWRCC